MVANASGSRPSADEGVFLVELEEYDPIGGDARIFHALAKTLRYGT